MARPHQIDSIGSLGRLALGGAVAALWLGACGGTPPPTSAVTLAFPPDALETVATVSGGLNIDLRAAPQPLVRGQNAAQLTVTDAMGAPVDGLTLAVVPWMPSHGHGSSVQPEITATGPGTFVVSPLYLFMAGRWELRTTIGGALDDTATLAVDIP